MCSWTILLSICKGHRRIYCVVQFHSCHWPNELREGRKKRRNTKKRENWCECFKCFTNNRSKINQSRCTMDGIGRGKRAVNQRRRKNTHTHTHTKFETVVAISGLTYKHGLNDVTNSKQKFWPFFTLFTWCFTSFFIMYVLVVVAHGTFVSSVVIMFVQLFDFSFICWFIVLEKSRWFLHRCNEKAYTIDNHRFVFLIS